MRRLAAPLEALLDSLAASDDVRAVDVAFARLLAGLEGEHGGSGGDAAERGRAVALAGALVSARRRSGHSTLRLSEWAGRPFPGPSADPLPVLPGLGPWQHALEASAVAGPPEAGLPLVLEGGRLALARLWHAERRVAAQVARRLGDRPQALTRGCEGLGGESEPSEASIDALAGGPEASSTASRGGREASAYLSETPGGGLEALSDLSPASARGLEASGKGAEASEGLPPALAEAFDALFPPRADGAVDLQASAALAALHRPFLLVAGGPGTGKTYTATRLLALLLKARPGLRIALAAPTGKAAGRLSESLAAGRAGLPPALAGPVPTEATTLHRLLGYHPERGFAYTARRPLPYDLVLVDEGSMVGLPLFDALLDALLPHARLVVLGDPDQLAPVDTGSVFADLCRAGTEMARAPLAGAVVTLTESRRFAPGSGVGALAAALQRGDARTAAQVLAGGRPDLSVGASPSEAIAWALPAARRVVQAASPEAALEALGRFRLLAVLRRGAWGVQGLGDGLEAALRREGLVKWSPWRGDEPFYPGRPLIVRANAPDIGLANGDVGVGWMENGAPVVCFPSESPGEPARRVPLARMPEGYEGAWALTVHQSQGSEFDAVGVVLPPPDGAGAAMVTRELLYTAVTRTRGPLALFGEPAFAAGAAERREHRRTALDARLAEAVALTEGSGLDPAREAAPSASLP